MNNIKVFRMKGSRIQLLGVRLLFGLAMLSSVPAGAESRQPTIAELSKQLKQRDALIEDLQKRVENLERRHIASHADTQILFTVQPGDTLPRIAEKVYGDEQKWPLIFNANRNQLSRPDALREGMKLVVPSVSFHFAVEQQPAESHDHAEAAGQPEAGTAAPARKGPAEARAPEPDRTKAAPGQFEVDEAAAERALERTLVVQGALLLDFGELELEPGIAYARSENDVAFRATAFDQFGNPVPFGVRQKTRRDIITSTFSMRAGLPFNAQLELTIPYQYVDGSRFVDFPNTIPDEENFSDTGLGDISIGLAKTFLREGSWWPDIIGRITWDTDTGEKDVGGISNGFNEINGSLTFLKRQDPLAFIGNAGYQKAFEKDGFKPGDQFDLSIGVSLAASPETSLSFLLNQSFVDDFEVNNRKIPGSDQYVGVMSIGASSVLGHGLFLNLTAGIGLTDDAPDYSVGLTLTKRLNWR